VWLVLCLKFLLFLAARVINLRVALKTKFLSNYTGDGQTMSEFILFYVLWWITCSDQSDSTEFAEFNGFLEVPKEAQKRMNYYSSIFFIHIINMKGISSTKVEHMYEKTPGGLGLEIHKRKQGLLYMWI
jgi:hypothetical protein